ARDHGCACRGALPSAGGTTGVGRPCAECIAVAPVGVAGASCSLGVRRRSGPSTHPSRRPVGLRANAPAHQNSSWADESLQVLVRAGRVLGASLDYHATLEALAALLVPDIADGCVVRLLGTGERFPQVHVAHRDAATQALIRDYYARF